MSTWAYTPRITPMAPSTSEPLRYPKPHHFQGLSFADKPLTCANTGMCQIRTQIGHERSTSVGDHQTHPDTQTTWPTGHRLLTALDGPSRGPS